MKRQPHPADFCRLTNQNFSGSMARHCGQWLARYTCQTCGRTTGWMTQNFLGGHDLVCTGERLWRPHEQTRANLGHDNFRALLNKGRA